MRKITNYPSNSKCDLFYPGSIIMVTAIDASGKSDICTVGAWALVNGSPRLFGIAMCARTAGTALWKRYTTSCIEQTGEFVINIPDQNLEKAWQICGTNSLTKEPELDKWERAGLTAVASARVKAPLIVECPVNIECRVYKKLELPTHDWIVGEPVAWHVDEDIAQGRAKFAWQSVAELHRNVAEPEHR